MKTIILISDDSEFKCALERSFGSNSDLKTEILSPLAHSSDWEATSSEIEKALVGSDATNTLILICASLQLDEHFQFSHPGMRLVHYLRSEREYRLPIVVYCVEALSEFIDESPFHRILTVPEGHYYWCVTEGLSSLKVTVAKAKPFNGDLYYLKKKYCTLQGLVGNVGHFYKSVYNKNREANDPYAEKNALIKSVEYLRICLPAEKTITSLERKVTEMPQLISERLAYQTLNEFIKLILKPIK